jgi:hypothetical protein
MLRTTEHENGQTIPLSGGAGAVRPWGGLWSRERTHPGAPRPLSLRATPPRRGFSWENRSKSDCSPIGSKTGSGAIKLIDRRLHVSCGLLP